MVAASRHDVLHATVRGSSGAEAWEHLETLAKAVLKAEALSLSTLALIALRLEHMLGLTQKHQEEAAELRVSRVLRALDAREADDKAAEKAEKSTDSDKGAAAMGYAAVFRKDFHQRIAQPAHQEFTAALQELFDQAAHPHVIIGYILEGGVIEYVHALFGIKDLIPSLPLVKRVAEELRDHGPTFLGQIAFELVLPARAQVGHDGIFAPLTEMWEQLRKGDVCFDMENDFMYVSEAFYQDVHADQVVKVPAAKLYTSPLRNQKLLRICDSKTGLFARIGFTKGPTMEDVLQEAGDFWNESVNLSHQRRGTIQQAFIVGVLKEKSAQLKRGLKHGDVNFEWGGAVVIANSASYRNFHATWDRAGKAVEMAKTLRFAGFPLSGDASIVPEDLGGLEGGAGAGASGSKPSSTPLSTEAAGANGALEAGSRGGDAAAATRAAKTTAAADAAKKQSEDAAAAKAKAAADKAEKEKAAAAKKAAGEEKIGWKNPDPKVAVGEKADRCRESGDGKYFEFLKDDGSVAERFDLVEFKKVAPEGACPGVWLSRHGRSFHAFCRHAKDARHETPRGGAHAVTASWQKTYLKLLTVALAAAPAAGFTIPTVSAAPVPRASHFFMPVMQAKGEAAWFGVPGGASGKLFGVHRSRITRDDDLADASRWSSHLFAGVDEAHAFYAFEEDASQRWFPNCSAAEAASVISTVV